MSDQKDMKIEQLEKEIQALKNNFAESKNNIAKLTKVNAAYITSKNEYDEHITQSNQKIKNLTDAITSLKTTIETQAQEGGVGGSSVNPKEIKEMIVSNIPYPQIAMYIQKQLTVLGVETKKDKELSSVKKKKGDTGKKVVKFIFILFLFAAGVMGAYKVYLDKKEVTYEIKKGTMYKDENGKEFRLTETSTFSGTIKEVKTDDGVKRYFIAKIIRDGKENKLIFSMK